jgi:hypothetical protein
MQQIPRQAPVRSGRWSLEVTLAYLKPRLSSRKKRSIANSGSLLLSHQPPSQIKGSQKGDPGRASRYPGSSL